MRNTTLFSSTLVARLPKVSGKACVELVGSMWAVCVQKIRVSHIHSFTQKALWITRDFVGGLYTNCIQVVRSHVDNSTPVILPLYTLYTAPITTTTTYINTIRRNS